MSAPASGAAQVGEWKVEVYLYDLSQGMARALSQQFLGKQIDGIWHTGVHVYGHEYFYGGGIQATLPGQSMAGRPQTVIDMGYTRIPPAQFHEFLRQVAHRFTAATYSLLEHNCNNFSNEAALFLTGRPIPAYITGLPAEALATPFGQMLRPMIAQMEGGMRGGAGGGAFGQPWAAEPLSLPRGIENLRPDRMVAESSNPATPHNVLEAAAALAAQAINQTAAGAPAAGAATAQAASAAAASASSSSVVSILKRSGPAKPLSSADAKAKSFQVLIKANAKKDGASPLSAQEEATLTELVNALSVVGGGNGQVKAEGTALVDGFVQKWPPALQFPVLGVLRLLVLRPECAGFYEAQSDALVKRLLSFLPSEEAAASESARAPAPAQAMALCTLANLFALPALAKRLANDAALWSSVRACLSASDSATVRLMAATVVFNAATVLPKDDSDVVVEAATFLSERVGSEAGADVLARLLLALTELVQGNDNLATLLVGIEFLPTLQQVQSKHAAADAQIALTCAELMQMLNQAQQATFQVQ